MPARQLAWLQLADGQRRAICDMPIESTDHLSRATITLWVVPDALRLLDA